MNYTGWLWDGTQFDSSWDRGEPATFALTGVIAGWTQGLVGQTVGSQVLLVIPPDLGYGDQASETIPAGLDADLRRRHPRAAVLTAPTGTSTSPGRASRPGLVAS